MFDKLSDSGLDRVLNRLNAEKEILHLLHPVAYERDPIFEEIPALYGKDVNKVELHTDKANSHPCKSTASYLAKKESKSESKSVISILFDELLSKLSDVSSMKLCALGLSKRALGKWHPRTVNGLQKTVQEECCKINSTERICTIPSGAQIYTLQPEIDLEDFEPKPGPLMSTDDDDEYLTDL
ncbi:uncharacterized protein TNCV_1636731 [Trichonephila clavipes]|nr:uncharacterized protein TNCV_1636731 [Trichonephila clavipes]